VRLICTLLQLYIIAVFARIILSWFPISPGGALASVYGFLYSITEPVLGPVRRALPPLQVGSMGIDLSPILVLFGIQIFASIIC
jgi:YggT family protein